MTMAALTKRQLYCGDLEYFLFCSIKERVYPQTKTIACHFTSNPYVFDV